MSETPEEVGEMVHRVAQALRAACLEEFGSTWSYDRSWKFARAAIAAMWDANDTMLWAGRAALPNEGGVTASESEARFVWQAMIEAALETQAKSTA